MFWRFGFHSTSSIDGLLDKEDVSLESILEQDDLLQECKSQNTRLIDYFQRVDVLQRLLGYVLGTVQVDEGEYKYPHTATEVLCSEIWSIVETCINAQDTLLVPFWESMLDRSPDEIKLQLIMAGRFARVNAVFMNKKPYEMFQFIRSQPRIIQRLLTHIEIPSFMDLLIRIIQLDELDSSVVEWLSSQNLLQTLLDYLSPEFPPDIHTAAAEMIKSIIALSTPGPGDGISTAQIPPSNRFARELAAEQSIQTLSTYILREFSTPVPSSGEDPRRLQTPTFESSTSSVTNSLTVLIELVRKNNSDYFEPYLFHTLRNRLISIQQSTSGPQDPGGSRETLENAMQSLTSRMGVVHLGPLLKTTSSQMELLVKYLKSPRSQPPTPLPTTHGPLTRLTFERFRICELIAELLHCSNMGLLNRSRKVNEGLYDEWGTLKGGLTGLEELARVMTFGNPSPNATGTPGIGSPSTPGEGDGGGLPVRGAAAAVEDEEMSDDEDTEPTSSDDEMVEIAMEDEQQQQQQAAGIGSSPSPGSGPASRRASRILSLPPTSPPEGTSNTSSPNGEKAEEEELVIGETLKACLLKVDVLNVLLDLFSAYPWNNFLHSAVYDIIHQILTGSIGDDDADNDTDFDVDVGNPPSRVRSGGYNKQLVLSLFRDAKLLWRIVEMQRRNDEESAKPKGLRLGYMGHLTLISEDVLIALERFPKRLRETILTRWAPPPHGVQPDESSHPDVDATAATGTTNGNAAGGEGGVGGGWEEYVKGRYEETKKKDMRLLGGGKPAVPPPSASGGPLGGGAGGGRWKVDEEELMPPSPSVPSPGVGGGGTMNGEFRRTNHVRASTADFGAPEEEEVEVDPAPRFTHYLAQETCIPRSRTIASEDDDDDDSDDDDPGWLSERPFSFGRNVPGSSSTSGAFRGGGFEDSFNPATGAEDPFADDDFGPFSDSSLSSSSSNERLAASFTSSIADDVELDDMDDVLFENFGDFGEFQSGELTPTGLFDGGNPMDVEGDHEFKTPAKNKT